MAFDIDRYAAQSQPLGWQDLELDVFREQHWLAQTLHAVTVAGGREPREPADTVTGRLCRTWDERCLPTVAAVDELEATAGSFPGLTGIRPLREALDPVARARSRGAAS